MRIILIQAEIELALRAYVLNQINIAEGQEISIEFKNTRGEDGATAEINIGNVPNEPTKKTQLTIQKLQTDIDLKTPSTTNTPVVAQSVADTTTTTSTTESPVEAASMSTETPSIMEEEPFTPPPFLTKGNVLGGNGNSDEPVIANSKSLFANLTPPVNTKTEQQ